MSRGIFFTLLFFYLHRREFLYGSLQPEMIAAHGYPEEMHRVITQDGYILHIHRIAATGKQPVLLMHGLLGSSATYTMLGPHKGLGYILYESGYDVWMANARGNIHSKGHLKYNRNGRLSDRKNYWNFSWHEIGKYDIPANIDYILEKTNSTKVNYIGHSQGTTSFFVMMSERPEYNDKILFATMMAPPIFMGHCKHKLLQLCIPQLDKIEMIAERIDLLYFDDQVSNSLAQIQKSIPCYLEAFKNTLLCNVNPEPFIFGNITEHVSQSMVSVLQTTVAESVSMKQLFHYVQLARSDRFCQYDYGLLRNLYIYRRRTPPSYNLKNCTVPIGIIYADSDTLAAAEDVVRLPYELPNVIEIRRVDDNTFNHYDFIFADDAKEFVYDYIIGWMKSVADGYNDSDIDFESSGDTEIALQKSK